MLSSAEAMIYLSDKRGCSQRDCFRSFHTFNFDSYSGPNRDGFGRLIALNDETIKAGKTLHYAIDRDVIVIILPLVGNVVCTYSDHEVRLVQVGEVFIKSLKSGNELELTNPYEIELNNFLQIRISNDGQYMLNELSMLDLVDMSNALKCIASEQNGIRLSIGKFDGRRESKLSLTDKNTGAFIFVIDGAFEVENRLLQSRDGLAIRNVDNLEFEALSDGAIILIIEAITPTH